MTYTVAVALGLAVALVLDLALLRTRLVNRRAFWTAYAIVLFFQLVSNGFLAGRGVVRYDPDTILGLRIVYAPVEDLGFGFALVLMTLSVWVRSGVVWPDARPAGQPAPRPAAPPAVSSARPDPDRTAAQGT
jgi:lycopene cyclase domain-containing protein